MVYTDRSGDTYFLTGFLSLLGYCLYGIFLFIHGNCMVVGFLSGGECCTCGGRVGNRICSGKVVAIVATGNCVNSSGSTPIRPFCNSAWNISVPLTWLTPIPSPMK